MAWGKGSAQDQAKFRKIYDRMVAAGGGGTVTVDILASDLKPLKSLHVASASMPGVLLKTLQIVVSSLSLKPGETLVKPRRQSLPQDAGPDDLALHLTARGFIQGEFPAESWIVYKASELPQICRAKRDFGWLGVGDSCGTRQALVGPRLSTRDFQRSCGV